MRRTIVFVLFLVLAVALASPVTPRLVAQEATPTAHDPAAEHAAFAQALRVGDPDAITALFSPAGVVVSPLGTFRGAEEIRAFYAGLLANTPGLEVDFAEPTVVHNTAVSRDLVAADPYREAGAERVVLIHTVVLSGGRIAALTVVPDLGDPATAALFAAMQAAAAPRAATPASQRPRRPGRSARPRRSPATRPRAASASPSRLFREEGGLVGEGFALGLLDKIRRIMDAAGLMVDAAATAVGPDAQAPAVANAGPTLGQSLAEGIRSEVASVVEATRMLADEATAAAMVRMEEVRREALRSAVAIGTTTATAAPEPTRSSARPTVHQRNVTIQEGAFPFNVRVEGAQMGDPEEFARRLRGSLMAHIADALETQTELGATDEVGF